LITPRGKPPETVKITYPYPVDDGVDSILSVLKEILVEGGVYRIVLTQGQPIEVDLLKEVAEEERPSPLLLADIIKTIELVNVPGTFVSPGLCLTEALRRISDDDLNGCFIVAQSRAGFSRWVSQGNRTDITKHLGMSVHEAPDLPKDVAIICASLTKIATPLDVVRGYKINLDIEQEVDQI
jgi:hypothetical protein